MFCFKQLILFTQAVVACHWWSKYISPSALFYGNNLCQEVKMLWLSAHKISFQFFHWGSKWQVPTLRDLAMDGSLVTFPRHIPLPLTQLAPPQLLASWRTWLLQGITLWRLKSLELAVVVCFCFCEDSLVETCHPQFFILHVLPAPRPCTWNPWSSPEEGEGACHRMGNSMPP